MSEVKEKLRENLKAKHDDDKVEIVKDEISGIEYIMPTNFFIRDGKILKLEDGKVRRVCATLVWPTAIIQNLDNGEEKIQLEMKRRGEVKKGIFLKSKVITGPTDLANFGVPVNYTNSSALAEYLTEIEIVNEDNIPQIKAVSKLGWREEKDIFLPFSKDTDIIIDIANNQEKWVNAYSDKGTLEEWVEAMRPFRENNKFRFIMSASFAAPLLKLIGHRIFVVFNWGNSRDGKTSALKAGLSVWGNPEDLTLTFNTTAVGIERLAGLYNDLPLALDEKSTNNQSSIEKIIYMLGNGISRIRGNKTGGIQQMNTWNTIVLATGEEPISDENSRTGVSTRCIEIEGSPYNRDEKKASEMYKIVKHCFGTAGPRFIENLINEYKEDDYRKLKDEYEEILARIEESTTNNVSSYVSAVSLITLADILIGKWLFDEEEGKSYEMAEEILEGLDKAEEIDIVEKCYELISSWILSHHSHFNKPDKSIEGFNEIDRQKYIEQDINQISSNTSYGLYEEGTYYVFPNVLRGEIENQGYSFRKITSEFAKRGYIKAERNNRGKLISTSIQKTFKGVNTRFYAFKLLDKKKYTEKEIEKIEEQAKKLIESTLKEQNKEFNEISSYANTKVEGVTAEKNEDSIEKIKVDLEKEKVK